MAKPWPPRQALTGEQAGSTRLPGFALPICHHLPTDCGMTQNSRTDPAQISRTDPAQNSDTLADDAMAKRNVMVLVAAQAILGAQMPLILPLPVWRASNSPRMPALPPCRSR